MTSVQKKPPLATWSMITRSKTEGGLGVMKLETQNDALLMKFLHKFFNKSEQPWVSLVWNNYYRNGCLPSQQRKGSFWWRSIINLLHTYKGIASPMIGNGKTILFWHDLWNNGVLSRNYSELYSITIDEDISLMEAKNKCTSINYSSYLYQSKLIYNTWS